MIGDEIFSLLKWKYMYLQQCNQRQYYNGLKHTVQTFNSCTSRPDVCHQCLVVQPPVENVIACESMLRSVVRSSVHSCTVHWVAIGRAVVCYVRAAYAFRAGITCLHCIRAGNTGSKEQLMLNWSSWQWGCATANCMYDFLNM